MALQVRRGLAANRTLLTPAEGELLYTTDTKSLYIGDGSTAGGNAISGVGGATYGISAETATGGANLRLTGSDLTTDDVKLAAGSNVTITRTDANTITIDASVIGGGGGTVTSVSGAGTVNGLTLTGTVTGSGSLTLGGTLSGIDNSALTNNSVSFNGKSAALGSSATIDLSDLGTVSITGTPTNGQVLKYNGVAWANSSDSGLTAISQDSSPSLGGNLDNGGYDITGSGDISILGSITTFSDLSANGVNITSNIDGKLITTGGVGLVMGTNGSTIPDFTIKGTFLTHRGVTAGGPALPNVLTMETARNALTNLFPVNVGDLIGGFAMSGYHDADFNLKGLILGKIDTVTGTNLKPGSIVFYVNDYDDNIVEAASINSRGKLTATSMAATNGLTTNGITSSSNTNLVLTASGTGKINLDGLLWPNADGTNGQALTTDGSGNLTWTTVSGAGALSSRTLVSATTASIADGATDDISILGGYKGYILYKINVDAAAWVRIYTDAASRTADSGRAEGVDPSPGAGVIAEVVTTGTQTILITPGAIGFNNEATPTTDIPISVKNKSGSTATITVSVTIVKIEA